MAIKFNEFAVKDPVVLAALKEIIFDLDKLRLEVGTDDGDSIFYASVYQRSASAPSTPTVDDGQYNFTTGTLTPPSGWSSGVPSGTDPVYISSGTFSINGVAGTDTTITWSSPVILAQDGTSSASGNSVFVANTYQRSASAPSTPSVDDGSFNFTTNVLTPPSGWSTTVPTGSNPVYVSSGTFTIAGSTGTDNTVTWTAPTILAQDGATGTEGSSFFTANIFIRAASAPATPSVDAGSFNFTTNVLTPPSGWSANLPAGSDPLYVSSGSFSISGSTGTDNTVTWTSPDLLVSDGAVGGSGDSILVANTYQRASSAPATPTTDDGSYNFTTNTLTPPSGWSIAPPAGTDPLYVSTGTFSISGTTGTDSTVTWTSPDILVQDGAAGSTGATGTAGNSSIVTQVYQRAASAPSTPSADDGSYNFTTNTLTPPSGWSITPPATDGNPLYASTGIFEISGTTGTDNTVTWTAPAILVSDGATGSTGSAGGDGNSVFYASAFQRAASAPSTPSANDGQYNFTTSTLTPPTGWSTEPPATDGNPLYVTNGVFEINGVTGTDTTVTWTAPAVLATDGATGSTGGTGAAGTDPITSQLTNPAHVVQANFDGTGYDLTGSGGTHNVLEGTTDRTTSATHSVVGGSGSPSILAQNGLTLSVVVATGVYSLSGASWTTDAEIFTLRAVYGGVTNDKTYTIVKARQGNDGGCGINTLTNSSLISIDTGTNVVGFQAHSDGTIDTKAGNSTPAYVNKQTWIGSCANTEYECRMTGSGTTPSGSALSTWLVMSTTRNWELSSAAANNTFTGTFEVRRVSDDTVVRTVSIRLEVESTV